MISTPLRFMNPHFSVPDSLLQTFARSSLKEEAAAYFKGIITSPVDETKPHLSPNRTSTTPCLKTPTKSYFNGMTSLPFLSTTPHLSLSWTVHKSSSLQPKAN